MASSLSPPRLERAGHWISGWAATAPVVRDETGGKSRHHDGWAAVSSIFSIRNRVIKFD